MRWVLWLLGLFALAVAAALALRLNTGDVLIVTSSHRIELSLNLLILLTLFCFVVGYLLLRFVFAVLQLPKGVREYHARRRREKARETLLEALRAFFEGRFGRAEKAAANAMELEEMPALGAVLAARAAHELRRFNERDAYLARAEKLAPDDTTMRIIAQADMLLEQRRFQEALLLLKALPSKHTAALRLEFKARQQAHNWEQVLTLIDQLERRNVFDAMHAAELRRYAHAENLKRNVLDRRSLEGCWQKIPAQTRRDNRVAAAAAQCFILLGGCAQATAIIEASLEQSWDSELIGLYAEYEGLDIVPRIERAESWLKQHPHDAALLRALGRLCAYQELWGKAQSYFEASIAVEPSYATYLELAHLHEKLGNSDAAREHYRASLELAVTQLRQISEGAAQGSSVMLSG
jgi:HemY protein